MTEGTVPGFRLMVEAMKASGVIALLGLFWGNGKTGTAVVESMDPIAWVSFESEAPSCMTWFWSVHIGR